MTIPGIQVPMNKKTVIPEPERHFLFSTKLMVMAIVLYEEEAPKATFALTPSLLSRSFDSLWTAERK